MPAGRILPARGGPPRPPVRPGGGTGPAGRGSPPGPRPAPSPGGPAPRVLDRGPRDRCAAPSRGILQPTGDLKNGGVVGVPTAHSVLKELPQEQDFVTLGLLILNPDPIRLSI